MVVDDYWVAVNLAAGAPPLGVCSGYGAIVFCFFLLNELDVLCDALEGVRGRVGSIVVGHAVVRKVVDDFGDSYHLVINGLKFAFFIGDFLVNKHAIDQIIIFILLRRLLDPV